MKSVLFRSYGGPEVLEVVEAGVPVPGPGEVCVRAEAIGVGVPDMLMRSGNYAWIPPLPVVPGNELAGIVSAVGPGVEMPSVGQRVYVNARELSQRGGCYAEYMVVPAASVFRLPDTLKAEHAVALGNYQLAWLLLNIAATPKTGDNVLVHAAAGGVGSVLVQMACAQGMNVCGVAGSEGKARYVATLGADAVIDRSQESISERVKQHTDGAGVKFIYDAVGGKDFVLNFDRLTPLGILVMFGYIAGWPDPAILDSMRERFGASLGFRLFSIHVLDDMPELRRRAMEEAIKVMASGAALPRIHTQMPLESAADAHRLLESGEVTGKIVLVP
ncbi:MAG: zinc-dependent alcohol dehydrogenase family protein [Alphaproteobacteria bacterium]|nr:zinc-dependent alcohol dehydrogenase family protein [Alphaproteobacteria bacterium]